MVQRNGAAKRWTERGTPGLWKRINIASLLVKEFLPSSAAHPRNKISPPPKRGGLIDRPDFLVRSDFGNGDSAFRANFNTGLAAETLIGIYRLGLAVLHLENLRRTSIDTLFITGTFIFINNNFPHGTTSKKNELRTKKRCYCNLEDKAKQYAEIVFL
jgi:hypothetical protein